MEFVVARVHSRDGASHAAGASIAQETGKGVGYLYFVPDLPIAPPVRVA